MHQIILLTAMTATSGLFGGGRQCTTGRCPSYRPVAVAAPAPVASYPAPQPVYAAPAPAVTYAPPATTYYQSQYYAPTAAAAACPNGNCPRR